MSIRIVALLGMGWFGNVGMAQDWVARAVGTNFPQTPPHLVLEVPRPRPAAHWSTANVPVEGEVVTEEDESMRESDVVKDLHEGADRVKEKVHGHFVHADKMGKPVAIPEAIRVPVWKTPYSYGHFGAKRNRQWSLHNGHQQTSAQWTLR